MDSPSDSPRTEDLDQQVLTEKEACAYLRESKRNLFCWRMAIARRYRHGSFLWPPRG